MAMFIIEEECIACGVCEPECPNDAILEGDPAFVIDAERCTECVGFHDERQCVLVCPVDCIVPHPEREENREVLEARFARLHGN